MESELNPIRNIMRLQKAKYLMASPGILLVIISFIINLSYNGNFSKFIALAGFIYYFLVMFCFRFSRIYDSSQNSNSYYAPITGRVEKIISQEKIIIIKKTIFDPVEVRSSTSGEIDDQFSLTGFHKIFEHETEIAQRLAGFLAGNGTCYCQIPENFTINITPGEKIHAGITVLASKK
ncbi:MAG: hypothetical protein JW996_04335 [Candidatus Cloacimonetes bacterium]|nr:hypothetical protein [Candidatus Cloacimonadota bacterium]